MMNPLASRKRPVVSWLFTTWLAACLIAAAVAQDVADPSLLEPLKVPQKNGGDSENWATEFLQDPLADIAQPSLQQMREALNDSKAPERVLRDHLPRATTLTNVQRRALLLEAVRHKNRAIQQQAVAEMAKDGFLAEFIRETLVELANAADPVLQEASIEGMEQFSMEKLPTDEESIDQLILEFLDNDPAISQAAEQQLNRMGTLAVPALLRLLDQPPHAVQAARLLGRIANGLPPVASPTEALRDRLVPSRPDFEIPKPEGPPKPGMPMRATAPPREPTIAKSRAPSAVSLPAREPLQIREMEESLPKTVRVYFGTNREILEDRQSPSWGWLAAHGLIACLALGLPVYWLIGTLRRNTTNPLWNGTGKQLRRRLLIWLVLLVVTLTNSLPAFSEAIRLHYSERQGVVFGPHRFAGGAVHYGYCDVSIPPSHRVGEVAGPAFGREDEAKHVMLRRAELLAKDSFFAQVRTTVQQFNGPGSCFVFVHGFNVPFDDAAKRTAQIFHDLEFPGAPIFFAWPSRGSVRHYFSDRNEVLFSRPFIKDFLLDVAARSGAERIHVIAHSMGADAVTGAIAMMGSEKKVFDQIILAAPDIDADVFRTQIVPKLQEVGKRTTLYCSRNDWALHASYHFNDSWRAGDSSRGLLVAPGMDTIDASSIDTELLGHSYYGNCLDILQDIAELVQRNPDPAARNLVNLPDVNPGPAWTFPRLLLQAVPDTPLLE